MQEDAEVSHLLKDVLSRMRDNSAEQFGREVVLEKKLDELHRRQIKLAKSLDDFIADFNVSLLCDVNHDITLEFNVSNRI